ncbi:hypothetical protein DMN91_005745 [Ooceraea biroi]|uniref:DUF4771 domain-containing protein n=1 Tax=Ooceraea biroi TaxID=2015173 RepID=A0A3L8DMG4_OOCBI|nr:hypothetical protein DMN91_005745 [Ooceraea biroi]
MKIIILDVINSRLRKWPKMDVRLKPFGFCCSMDRFDPLSRYDQRMPPYKSSLTAITSVHECPVSKIQTQFFTPRLSRNKKRLGKGRMSEMEDQQRLGNDTMNYFHINRRDGSIKWYLEDEIALAKNIFWTEKQRVHNEERDKIISIAKKQMKKRMKYLLNLRYPRWYQDFSPNQMKNLMNLENVMRTDYEETTTSGTQKSLMAIGVVSTFFTLKPIVIKELHKSCNLNGVDFLREIYKILTGNDFLEEGYSIFCCILILDIRKTNFPKKVYDCNERIILSAIAFLTLPQTVEELHKRLPPVIMPKLPPKPKPPTCFPRRKDSCPYKEELFRRSDWAGYRNKLQKWQKQYKLLAVPKVILPYQKYNQLLNNNNAALKFKKQGKNIYGQLEKDSAKELQKISATKLDQTSMTSIDYQLKHKKDFSKREISEVEKSIIDVPQLPDKKTLVLKPPRASQKSWLGEKDAHYVISGAYEDAATGSVTYEISGVANVTPSNSDERFFAVLKRDKPKKIFPGGRENLSRNWQEWLQNADEEFRQVEDEADELIKSIQSITKLSFPEPVCDSCCLCRQTRKTRERMRQSKAPYLLIDNIIQNDENKDKKKIAVDETEQLDGRKREMARLKNMLKLPIGILGDVQPALLPEELQAIRQSEEKTDDLSDSAISIDEEESRIRKGPCGWRTKSEQELPAKKTLAYLCEPDYPLESMAIRPGGRPCDCRENRSKKKILKYNVGGLVEKKDGRGARRTKLREENRIIDGVAYFTPPASPRRSDEYIPEYDLLESPYDMCVGEVTDERLKLIEKYSGPKSLIEKTRKRAKSCRCNSGVTKEARFADRKKDIEETRQKLMESKSPEERWTVALKDAALTDYFTQPRDRTRCWTSCRKYARSVRPRRLKVVKPVCECKNERKIVERNEERSRWKMRQRRLKALKKQAFMHVVDTSRPIVENTNLIISEVQRIPRKTEHEGDVKYCISGVAKDLSVSPPQPILDGLKMSTPFQTPEPSKEDIPSVALHRHWSPMDVPPGPLPRKDAALKEEMNRRKKARDEALTLIYGDMNERDSTRRTYQNVRDQGKPMQGVGKTQETWKSHKNVEEKTSGAVIELCSSSKKTDSEIKRQDTSREIIVSKVIPEDEKYFEEATGKIGYRSDTSYKQIIERTGEDEQRHQINDSDDKKRTSSQPNLTQIIKAELKKMSEEGYVFAKLPKCYLMPQLQDWIMHREGVAFSETDKKNLMRETVSIWQLIETIEKEKATFHSGVRKARVSHARTMWSTMEFGKFPSASFKRAFFTYMASKEADGHVYRPWLTSEVCGRDPDFSCYQ